MVSVIMAPTVALCLILIVSLIGIVDCRPILRSNSSDDQLVSDGIGDEQQLNLSCCSHQYGFLPCAENAVGYAFLAAVYQVLLVLGDMLICSGSEVLFYITGHKFGGVLFRFLRVLPSMALVIFSGVLIDKQHAQSQVSVGVAIYTGITVFSLTIQWIMCLVSSKESLKEESEETSRLIFPKIKGRLCRILLDNGTRVDENTRQTAKIMMLSLIPYVALLLVFAFDYTPSVRRTITLIALVVSVVSILSYFAYQIRNPWMLKRSLDVVNEIMLKIEQNKRITEEEFIHVFIKWRDEAKKLDSCNESKDSSKRDAEQLLKSSEDRRPSIERIRSLFRELDSDDDGCISRKEFKRVIDNDVTIKNQLMRVLEVDENREEDNDKRMRLRVHLETVIKDKWRISKSVIKVLVGIVMVTFMARPLMANLINLSNAINHNAPNYAISFVAVPLAMNLRILVPAIFFPAPTRKREDTSSLAFSEIYGGVIVNNMAGLTTSLAVVYAKDLTWDFSTQVLTIVVVSAIVGTHASFSKVYRLWTYIPIFCIYFTSTLLFYYEV